MKTAVWFPFLFVAYVILSLVTSNLDQLDPAQSLRSLALLLLAGGAALLLLWAVFRNVQLAGYRVFLLLALLFLPAHVYRFGLARLPLSPPVARWGALALIAVGVVLLGRRQTWQRLGGAQTVTPFLNVTFAIALLTQVLFALPQWIDHLRPRAGQAAQPPVAAPAADLQLDCSRSPDIYYIVLDAYGRADVLQELYGVDTTPFLQSLEAKGFTVIETAHSNYIQTIFSIGSALNFSYILPEPPGVSGRDYFTQKISDNRLIALLETCGYQTITFDTGFFFTNHVAADTHLSAGPPLNEFESLLLADTPLEPLAARLNRMPAAQSYAAHRARVTYVLDQLQRLPSQSGPKFVFAHILSPHPPFVFSADGKPIEPPRSYSTGDGDDYAGSPAEYRAGYAAQVQFINREIERVVDAILEGSNQPPIIILQGDHGPGSGLDWDSPDQTCLWERTAILNAYYLPGDGAARLDQEITPVNSFRLILNTYFGTDQERLPDQTFFTSQRLPRQVIDVTDRRLECRR